MARGVCVSVCLCVKQARARVCTSFSDPFLPCLLASLRVPPSIYSMRALRVLWPLGSAMSLRPAYVRSSSRASSPTEGGPRLTQPRPLRRRRGRGQAGGPAGGTSEQRAARSLGARPRVTHRRPPATTRHASARNHPPEARHAAQRRRGAARGARRASEGVGRALRPCGQGLRGRSRRGEKESARLAIACPAAASLQAARLVHPQAGRHQGAGPTWHIAARGCCPEGAGAACQRDRGCWRRDAPRTGWRRDHTGRQPGARQQPAVQAGGGSSLGRGGSDGGSSLGRGGSDGGGRRRPGHGAAQRAVRSGRGHAPRAAARC